MLEGGFTSIFRGVVTQKTEVNIKFGTGFFGFSFWPILTGLTSFSSVVFVCYISFYKAFAGF